MVIPPSLYCGILSVLTHPNTDVRECISPAASRSVSSTTSSPYRIFRLQHTPPSPPHHHPVFLQADSINKVL
ncbi:hypothetical protein ElyMa_006265500 [Elysia marginata]|uniref:Uncharacterized protein n=1 Tax=Elysia marginata TaxID=1093978 RepID=A0AAV4HBA6_9GAST|nr:hypothetical protein ElyMa_006265500 [Elysia marginata]